VQSAQSTWPLRVSLLFAAESTLVPCINYSFSRPSTALIHSRANEGERWTTPEVPGIALRIVKKNAVPGNRLAVYITGLATAMAQDHNRHLVQRLPDGIEVFNENLKFSVCPDPRGNPLLTWNMAERVLVCLSRYLVRNGFLVQFIAYRAGATPEQDVAFARGSIEVVTIS